MSEAAAEAAAGVLSDVGLAPTDAPAEPEVEAVEQEPEAEFDPSPELPDDLVAELDEPDFEEPEASFEPEEKYEAEEDEYEDPALSAERNKRVALEKKLKWLEEQKLKSDRKRWVEKDAKYFPLADVQSIAQRAKSRGEFARLAKAENERIKKIPGIAKMISEKSKQEIVDQWGEPSGGPGMVPSDATDAAEKHAKVRREGNLKETIKSMFETGAIKNV